MLQHIIGITLAIFFPVSIGAVCIAAATTNEAKPDVTIDRVAEENDSDTSRVS